MEEQQSSGAFATLRVPAGMQAGTAAGIVMLLWIMTGSWAHGQSFWTIPNLLAFSFYGNRMYRPDFVWRTWSGLGLHFFFSILLGVLFASLLPTNAKPRTAVFWGVVYSLILYSAAGVWFWDRYNPPMALYARQPFVLFGYVLFGAALGSTPWFQPGKNGSPPPALLR